VRTLRSFEGGGRRGMISLVPQELWASPVDDQDSHSFWMKWERSWNLDA
jgi:hypothetical protein